MVQEAGKLESNTQVKTNREGGLTVDAVELYLNAIEELQTAEGLFNWATGNFVEVAALRLQAAYMRVSALKEELEILEKEKSL
jgi:hypothetical protein